MIQIIKKIYPYCNYITERLTRIKTDIWYKKVFGKVGKKCAIFKPIRLIGSQNIYLGDNVRIYKDSRIETIERWGNTKFNPSIVIGSGTTFEQRLHLTCASKVEIGHDVVFLPDIMITDINHKYEEVNKNVMQQGIEVKETTIGNYSFIGMGAKIMAGTKLGRNCIVGSNSVVMGEFPDYSVIVGVPAKIIKRFNFETGQWTKTNINGEFVE